MQHRPGRRPLHSQPSRFAPSIDLRAGTVTVAETLVEIEGWLSFDTPKSHQKRVVDLPAFVVARLRCHLATMDGSSDALLFIGRRGGPLHHDAWRTAVFDPAVRAVGLTGVTPHDLRASHATWVAERHGVIAAAARLGHAHASVTTRHYARVVAGQGRVIADDLDKDQVAKNWPPADGARWVARRGR